MQGTKLKFAPHSPEWFGARLGKFTSSEIYKILGTGKSGQLVTQTGRSYILSKVAESLSDVAPEQISPKSIEWGRENEKYAIASFAHHYQVTVETETAYDADVCFGTPDGETDTHVLEIKCPYDQTRHIENMFIADASDLKATRPEYYWQLMMNMMLTSKEMGYFISYDPRMKQEARMKVIEVFLNPFEVETLVNRINLATQLKDEYLLNFAKML